MSDHIQLLVFIALCKECVGWGKLTFFNELSKVFRGGEEVCAKVHVWRSEDNLPKSFLFPPCSPPGLKADH